MSMAERIQYLRKKEGLSQEELADIVGVSRQAVSKWEGDQSTPDLKNIIAMSDFFETTTDFILRGIEPIPTIKKKTFYSLYLSFAVIFATIAGVWSFTANRFRMDECLFIIMAGALVGLGVGFIFQIYLNWCKR